MSASNTPGFSDSAEYVDRQTHEEARHLQESAAFGIGSVLRDELGEVWEECRVPNWDGFNALPIEQTALRNAYTLLESLPLGFPAPSVGAEPDGHLTLEWYRGPRRTISVSVSPDDELHFAALFGPSRSYGTEAFFGEIPKSILALIWRLYAT